MDSQPSALTGSTAYSFPPRSGYATRRLSSLCVEDQGVAEPPSCCAVELLLSVCLAHCQAIPCQSQWTIVYLS